MGAPQPVENCSRDWQAKVEGAFIVLTEKRVVYVTDIIFKAYSVTNEIDLNKIAVLCGIPKKYTWEEPLILHGNILASMIGSDVDKGQKVMVFAFGSIVFMNMSSNAIDKFIAYMRTIQPNIVEKNIETYSDDYELKVVDKQNFEMEITDKYVLVPSYEVFYPELISTAIAKSVALEKSEEQISKILDMVENVIERFEKGNLFIKYKEVIGTVTKVVRHQYNTVAYIMILDKPDITWTNSVAAEFYNKIAEFFELNDRYEVIKEKSDVLNNIVSGFSSISHSSRSLFLEWLIVALIVVEIVIMLIELVS